MESSKPSQLLLHRKGRTERSLRLVRELLAGIDTGEVREVLEIGCGGGRVAAALMRADASIRVLGVDPDPRRIQAARERYKGEERLRFEIAEASSLPLPDDALDLVVTQASYGRLHEWQGALSEIARVLKPTGHLFWLDLDVPYELRALLRLWRHRYGLYTPEEVAVAHGDEPAPAPAHYRRIERRAERRSPLILVKEPRAA